MAQTEAPAPKACEAKTETEPTTYRLTYTITELDGAKRIGTQHFSMTLNCVEDRNAHMSVSQDASFRLESKIPVVRADPSNKEKEFQYVDVGLNVISHVRKFATGVEVTSRLEQTGLGGEQPAWTGDSVIRHTTLSNTALLTLGKPMMLGSLDILGSTRHLDIEAVIEVVR
jgi:hypothetical protein